jgi:formate dehydrogenase subunit gamma
MRAVLCDTGANRASHGLRLLLAVLLAMLLAPAWAGVPNNRAQPAYAEEQTILQAQSDSVAPEPGLASADSGKVHLDRHYLGQYGSKEGDVIVQRGGNEWRVLRNGPFASITGTLVLVVPLLIFLFYLAAGPMRVEAPESGRRILRFTSWERTIHWATAISFLLLAATGLIILFGKLVFLPWMGHDLFATLAILSKYIHNFVGPVFIACSVLLFLTFLHRNVFRRWDWQWIRQAGGMLTHGHIPAGFFNAGEKMWFWFGLTLLGLLMSGSGLVLDFVTFGQTRYVLQVANYLHLAGATIYIVAAMAHIYMGTLGTPGAYEAMRHGTVDEEWARTHHEIWYDEVKSGPPPAGPAPGQLPPRTRPGTAP